MPSTREHDEKELAAFIRDGLKRLPDQAFGDYYGGKSASCALDACKKRIPLAAILVHLNDDHRWSREQIAAWPAGDPQA